MVIRIPSGNGVCPGLPHFEESRRATVLSDVVPFVCAIAVPTAIDLASIPLMIAGSRSGLRTLFGVFCQLAVWVL